MKRSTRALIPVPEVAAALAHERRHGGDLATLQGVALGLDIPWSEVRERLEELGYVIPGQHKLVGVWVAQEVEQ